MTNLVFLHLNHYLWATYDNNEGHKTKDWKEVPKLRMTTFKKYMLKNSNFQCISSTQSQKNKTAFCSILHHKTVLEYRSNRNSIHSVKSLLLSKYWILWHWTRISDSHTFEVSPVEVSMLLQDVASETAHTDQFFAADRTAVAYRPQVQTVVITFCFGYNSNTVIALHCNVK